MTAIAAPPRPPGRRPSGFHRLLTTELKLFVREPMLLFWGLMFPVGLLVVLGHRRARQAPALARQRQADRRLHAGGHDVHGHHPRAQRTAGRACRPTGTRDTCVGCRPRRSARSGCWPLRSSSTSASPRAAVILVALVSHFAFSVALPQQTRRLRAGDRADDRRDALAGDAGGRRGAHPEDRGGRRLAAVLPADVLRRPVGAAGLRWGRACATSATTRRSGRPSPRCRTRSPATGPAPCICWCSPGYAVVLCAAAARLFRWER